MRRPTFVPETQKKKDYQHQLSHMETSCGLKLVSRMLALAGEEKGAHHVEGLPPSNRTLSDENESPFSRTIACSTPCFPNKQAARTLLIKKATDVSKSALPTYLVGRRQIPITL